MQELQNDSAVEEILRKLGVPSLEICGASACVNCLNSLGKDTKVHINKTEIQPDDLIAIFLNDPKNYPLLLKARSNLNPSILPGNRVPQYYPLVSDLLFNIKAEFRWGIDFTQEMVKGNKVQACLKTPSHYIALTDYKDGIITFQDSWPQRPGLSNKGLNEKISLSELSKNLENWHIVYFK